MSADTIVNTYKQFLSQLLRTKCLYKGEKEDDDFVLRRQEKLLNMIDEIATDKLPIRAKQFISFFNDITNIVREKKPVNLVDAEFFNYFSKVIEKKNNKCGGVFFLNDSKDKNHINIGCIVKSQSQVNIYEIKNFIYILYVQCCNLIYPNIFNSNDTVPSSIYNNYHDILKDFETPVPTSNSKDEVKTELKNLLKDILPSTGDENILNDPSLSKIIDSVLTTMCPEDKLDELKNDIQNTNKDELLSTVKDIKEKMTNFDLEKIFESLMKTTGDNDNIDPVAAVAQTLGILQKEGLVDGINPEDINSTMKAFTEGEGSKILEDTIQSMLSENKI